MGDKEWYERPGEEDRKQDKTETNTKTQAGMDKVGEVTKYKFKISLDDKSDSDVYIWFFTAATKLNWSN